MTGFGLQFSELLQNLMVMLQKREICPPALSRRSPRFPGRRARFHA